MPEISDDQVVKLVRALAEAARADRRTATRFVPPRTGILEETASRRHQFVFGRRGVGKSTLLRKIESAATDSDVEVIFVDIETLRGRPYPDVLIELLIELLDALEKRLVAGPRRRVIVRLRRRRTLGRIRTLRQALRALLNEPQTAERTIRELSARQTRAGFAGSVDVNVARRGRVGAGAELTVGTEQQTTSEATFVRSKMDGLLDAAVLIRAALAEAQEHLGDTASLIVLDDFYHVPYDDQADVLAYLHQTVKNLDIFFKVCGVRHRVQPFVEDDPPRGMQIGQDAGEVSLDITLERFSAAQAFLEAVLRGMCEPLGVAIEDLLTDGGRQRLVLGSGGVARDYLNLTQKALRNANERDANPSRPHNRITAEDVNEAAAELSGQKRMACVRNCASTGGG